MRLYAQSCSTILGEVSSNFHIYFTFVFENYNIQLSLFQRCWFALKASRCQIMKLFFILTHLPNCIKQLKINNSIINWSIRTISHDTFRRNCLSFIKTVPIYNYASLSAVWQTFSMVVCFIKTMSHVVNPV